MKKAVQKAVRPTVADLVSKLDAPLVRLTPDQREQMAAVFAHNDAEPNLRRRLGAIPVHRFMVENYGYQGSRQTLERDAVREFKRVSWARK
jgi:hypothetical protein